MKQGRLALIAVLGVLGILAIAVLSMGAIYQSTSENAVDYYSRINNDLVVPITPHGGMSYRYTLQAYTESGAGKNLDLDTSRELRDGAYVLVRVAPLRGVISWEEVSFDELPASVRIHYKK